MFMPFEARILRQPSDGFSYHRGRSGGDMRSSLEVGGTELDRNQAEKTLTRGRKRRESQCIQSLGKMYDAMELSKSPQDGLSVRTQAQLSQGGPILSGRTRCDALGKQSVSLYKRPLSAWTQHHELLLDSTDRLQK